MFSTTIICMSLAPGLVAVNMNNHVHHDDKTELPQEQNTNQREEFSLDATENDEWENEDVFTMPNMFMPMPGGRIMNQESSVASLVRAHNREDVQLSQLSFMRTQHAFQNDDMENLELDLEPNNVFSMPSSSSTISGVVDGNRGSLVAAARNNTETASLRHQSFARNQYDTSVMTEVASSDHLRKQLHHMSQQMYMNAVAGPQTPPILGADSNRVGWSNLSVGQHQTKSTLPETSQTSGRILASDHSYVMTTQQNSSVGGADSSTNALSPENSDEKLTPYVLMPPGNAMPLLGGGRQRNALSTVRNDRAAAYMGPLTFTKPQNDALLPSSTVEIQRTTTYSESPEKKANPPAAFPQRLLHILSNDSLSGIITWLPHGKGFVVVQKKRFAEEIMPKYFSNSTKYTSFTRKLNRWNFTRVTRGPEAGAYYHPLFRRDEPELSLQMTCLGSSTTQQTEPMNPVALGLATPAMLNLGLSVAGSNAASFLAASSATEERHGIDQGGLITTSRIATATAMSSSSEHQGDFFNAAQSGVDTPHGGERPIRREILTQQNNMQTIQAARSLERSEEQSRSPNQLGLYPFQAVEYSPPSRRNEEGEPGRRNL